MISGSIDAVLKLEGPVLRYPLQAVASIGTGTKPPESHFKDGASIAYLNGGVKPSGYVTGANTEGDAVAIPSRGSVGVVGYSRLPFWCGPLCYRVRSTNSDLMTRYLYYALKVQEPHIVGLQQTGSIPALNKAQLAKVEVPIPPLRLQREIVRILDNFTELEAELEAELDARRVQQSQIRGRLLQETGANSVIVRLGDLGRVVTGRTPSTAKLELWGDDLDFVTPSDIKNGMREVNRTLRGLSSEGARGLAKNVIPAGSILVTCIGADMGKTVINMNDCVTNQQINSIVLDAGVSRDFMFHTLTAMRSALRRQGEGSGSTLPLINKSEFSNVRIALPPLETQERIAMALNQFDDLVNDQSIGLPAELVARRKQYEYYRDKLLTFEEALA